MQRTLETFLTYPMFQVRHPACRPTRVHAHVVAGRWDQEGCDPQRARPAGQAKGWGGGARPTQDPGSKSEIRRV